MIFETKLVKAVWISSHPDLDFVYLQLIFIPMGIFALFQIWRHSNLLKFCFKDFSWSNWIFRFLNSIWWMNVLLSRHVCILGSCIPPPNDSFWGFQRSKNYFSHFLWTKSKLFTCAFHYFSNSWKDDTHDHTALIQQSLKASKNKSITSFILRTGRRKVNEPVTSYFLSCLGRIYRSMGAI